MSNIHSDNELEMARFGEYLLKSRVVLEKHAPFYVRWVRKFMDMVPDKPGLTFEDRVSVFLDNLKPNIEGWQLDQAEKAVRLYFSHCLKLSGSDLAVSEIKPDAEGFTSKIKLLDATRNLIRLRHYSRTTEVLFMYQRALSRTLHEHRAMPAQRAVMWRLCRHKRGRPRSYRRTCSSTKRHVLRHRAWDRLVLCRSRLLQESSPTRNKRAIAVGCFARFGTSVLLRTAHVPASSNSGEKPVSGAKQRDTSMFMRVFFEGSYAG